MLLEARSGEKEFGATAPVGELPRISVLPQEHYGAEWARGLAHACARSSVTRVDPAAMASLKAAVERLDAWRASALAEAENRDAARAAQWIYAASLALNAADQLRLQFVDLLDEIKRLDSKSSQQERSAVADSVQELARREVLLGRVTECAGILREASDERPGWFSSVVRYFGGQREKREAEDLLWRLASYAEDIERWLGARQKAPTPTGITDVESALRAADDDAALEKAKELAGWALDAVDVYRLREARNVLGRLRSRVASTYGLPAPPSIEVQ